MGRPSTKFPAAEVATREDFEFFVEDHRYGDTDRYDWRSIRRKASTVIPRDTKREAMNLRAKLNDAIESCLTCWGNIVSPDLLEVIKEVRARVDDLGELARSFIQDRFSYIQSCFSFSWIREQNRASRGLPSAPQDAKRVQRGIAQKVKSYASIASENLKAFWQESVTWEVLDAWVALRNSYMQEDRHDNWFLDRGEAPYKADKCNHPAYEDFRKVFFGSIPKTRDRSDATTFFLYIAIYLPNRELELFRKPNGWLNYPVYFHSDRYAQLCSKEQAIAQLRDPDDAIRSSNCIARCYPQYIEEILKNCHRQQVKLPLLTDYQQVNQQIALLTEAIKMYTDKGKEGGMQSLELLSNEFKFNTASSADSQEQPASSR